MTDLPKTTAILTQLDRGWLTIWFNTPENRNALSETVSAELMMILNSVRDDRAVRGISLRGKGGVFCAGGDLGAFHMIANGGARKDIVAMNAKGGELFEQINTMPQVVVALVEGAAIAGGVGIICCADIVAVTKQAKFALTETQLGIIPAQIAPFVVGKIGLPTARRLMVTGARFDGAEAQRIGLADYAVDDSPGLDQVQADIHTSVNRCSPMANAAIKQLLVSPPALNDKAMREYAAERFTDCMLSEDGREGITAFVTKRKPKWAEQE